MNILPKNITPLLIIFSFVLAGCSPVGTTIQNYRAVAGRIQLGDSKERVLDLLGPTQEKLPYDEMKDQDSYLEDGNLMEIYYARSGRQPDNLTTDDEFTPYIFKNGKLVAIGWKTLGGPKSFGKVLPPANVTNIHHTTVIEKD